MYSYALLECGCHYLIQEKENEALQLIKVAVESDLCMYVIKYGETAEYEWRKKTDSIHEILELLSDQKVAEWESVYNDNQDAYYEEDEE
ncbi:hypothetical protein [Gynurincola endophyticus]|jgi:hypothetical protein|uniref:hypothetical protein n=1 Tax=Gynurincola endophyticus TaxID=2479004 RepID=UPI000F8DE27B|nr:hypothetical protein [Gynurincola endophyticus]